MNKVDPKLYQMQETQLYQMQETQRKNKQGVLLLSTSQAEEIESNKKYKILQRRLDIVFPRYEGASHGSSVLCLRTAFSLGAVGPYCICPSLVTPLQSPLLAFRRFKWITLSHQNSKNYGSRRTNDLGISMRKDQRVRSFEGSVQWPADESRRYSLGYPAGGIDLQHLGLGMMASFLG